jgi:hypothetical protein
MSKSKEEIVEDVLRQQGIDPETATLWQMIQAMRSYIHPKIAAMHPTVSPMALTALLVLHTRMMEILYAVEGINPYEDFNEQSRVLDKEKNERLKMLAEAADLAIKATLQTLEGTLKDGEPLFLEQFKNL